MEHSPPRVPGRPVLVALDLTERSQPCLRYGCEMAKKFHQPLVLVHVVHETAETTGIYRRNHQTLDTTPMQDIARNMLEKQVADFRDTCDGLDSVCDVHLAVVPGIPATRIAELAQHYSAGMIVMCSHNRNRPSLSRRLQGSVTASVMRATTCPVVVIGPEEDSLSGSHLHHEAAENASMASAVV